MVKIIFVNGCLLRRIFIQLCRQSLCSSVFSYLWAVWWNISFIKKAALAWTVQALTVENLFSLNVAQFTNIINRHRFACWRLPSFQLCFSPSCHFSLPVLHAAGCWCFMRLIRRIVDIVRLLTPRACCMQLRNNRAVARRPRRTFGRMWQALTLAWTRSESDQINRSNIRVWINYKVRVFVFNATLNIVCICVFCMIFVEVTSQ